MAEQPQAIPAPPLMGQKALVTGASSGIGRAIALALARAGADVLINYVSAPAAAEATVQDIGRCGRVALAHRADVSGEPEVEAMFARMLEAFGSIDILVANAGLQQDAPIADMTLERWHKVLSVNLTGQFLCSRAAVRAFRRRGAVKQVSRAAGKIICMSSVHQVIPWAGHSNYAARKAAWT
jgi:glucose 1-dehydrogenase